MVIQLVFVLWCFNWKEGKKKKTIYAYIYILKINS